MAVQGVTGAALPVVGAGAKKAAEVVKNIVKNAPSATAQKLLGVDREQLQKLVDFARKEPELLKREIDYKTVTDRIKSQYEKVGEKVQELGNQADINYKFLGEIERGQQNPSFNSLVKISAALEVELSELFRFEQEISDRKEIETTIKNILKTIPDDEIRQVLMILRTLYPMG